MKNDIANKNENNKLNRYACWSAYQKRDIFHSFHKFTDEMQKLLFRRIPYVYRTSYVKCIQFDYNFNLYKSLIVYNQN